MKGYNENKNLENVEPNVIYMFTSAWLKYTFLLYSYSAPLFWIMRFPYDAYTVKPVCNDHFYNEIYYPWFI